MDIYVDASILEYDSRGISKVTNATYFYLKNIYPNINIFLLQSQKLKANFDCEHKKITKPFYTKDISKVRNDYFPKVINKKKPDFIHFPANGNFSENYFKQKGNTKIITTIHDIIPAVIPNIDDKINPKEYLNNIKKYIDMSDIVITVSENSKNDLIKYLNIDKEIHVVYPSYFLNKIVNENIYGDYFLYNGGYSGRKGIDLLISNFLQLKIRDKLKSKLVLTGEKTRIGDKNSNENIRELIDFGISRNWIYELGHVSDEYLSSLFVNAKALVYLSLYEGFGLPPLEAMHLGCPVLTSKLSSIPEVCKDAVYYADRNNEDEIQNALISLEKDEALRNKLIEKGFQRSKMFSWEESAKKYMNILNNNL